ncbi:MAG: hypothetical protein H0V40_01415, partial [Actinobacteria bacterium]|nr:hypothetical protein [Actinomycetota bacterium]
MVETVKWETLRELAAFRAELGCAISLFLNLDPSVSPTAADAETRLHSLLGTGERSDGAAREHLDHEAREALKADLERIRGYVENEFDRTGVQGLAIFAAGLDGVWRPLPLVKPVADGVSVGSTFALAPLVGHLDTREALVAVISREHGELFRVDDGRLEEVVDKSEETPRRHDQGGRSQARFQRHVDEVSAEHLRTVADELNRQIRAVDDPDLVIVCPEPIRSTVETLLAKEAKDALAGWASAEAHARPAELFEIVQPLL